MRRLKAALLGCAVLGVGCGQFVYGRGAGSAAIEPAPTQAEQAPKEAAAQSDPKETAPAEPDPKGSLPKDSAAKEPGVGHAAVAQSTVVVPRAPPPPETEPVRKAQSGPPASVTRSKVSPVPWAAAEAPFFDVTTWLTRQGVSDVSTAFAGDDVDLDECRLLGRVDHIEAVSCPRREPTGGLLVVHQEVWLPDHGKLKRVLSVPVSAGSLDSVNPDIAVARGVKLALSFDERAKTVDVSDEPDVGCDAAYARYHELLSRRRLAQAAATFKREVDVVCDARGRYVYQNGTFRVDTSHTPRHSEPLGRQDALAGGRD